MLADCKPQDNWLLLSCGDWKEYNGWKGPARTLIQVWETDAPQDEQLRITLAYNMWELTPDGVPTGEIFASGTGKNTRTGLCCWQHIWSTALGPLHRLT
jgi:hypothetical protein